MPTPPRTSKLRLAQPAAPPAAFFALGESDANEAAATARPRPRAEAPHETFWPARLAYLALLAAPPVLSAQPIRKGRACK